MTLSDVIDELEKLALAHQVRPQHGKTAKHGEGHSFENVMFIEEIDDEPMQAWVNTQDQKRSCGINFRRRSPRITFGRKPFCGDRSRVKKILLPTQAMQS